MRIGKTMAKISSMTFISRVLGFIRDAIISSILGATPMADAFVIAQKFPNIFRRLFAEGAVQAAFIPIFTPLKQGNTKKARLFANQIYTILVLTLSILIIILEILMPYLVRGMLQGYKENPEMQAMVTLFMRITMPYLFFIALVSFYSSVLNAFYKFTLVALAPALLNIGIIACIWQQELFASQGLAASTGVLIGGILQWVLMLYGCHKLGWKIQIVSLKKLSTAVKIFFKRLLPVTLGAGIYQVNILIDTIVFSFLPAGSVVYLYLADRLTQLPLALIGIALGTIILPMLTHHIKNKKLKEANDLQETALIYGITLSLPAMIGLILLANPIISTLFEHGIFLKNHTAETVKTLIAYSLGIPSASMVKVLVPSFYARGDTKTPFITTALSLGIYGIGLIFLVRMHDHVGFALASSIASTANAAMILWVLYRRSNIHLSSNFFKEIIKAILACITMAIGIMLLIPSLETGMQKGIVYAIVCLSAMGLWSIALWAVSLWGLKASIVQEVSRKKK